MKIKILLFSLVFPVFLVITASAQKELSQNDWLGKYNYGTILNRNPSGYTDTIEYNIEVFLRGGQIFARYAADGLRTWDDYECTIKISGNQLDLYYLKDLRKGELGGNDRELKKGQFLGSLVKSIVRGKARFTMKNAPLIDVVRNPVFRKKV